MAIMAATVGSLPPLRLAPSLDAHVADTVSFPSLRSIGRPLAVTAVHTPGVSSTPNVGGEEGFVEVGYVSSAHGLKGEVRVVSSTDFPELRFGKPGKRWLRMQMAGKQMVREVDLVEGRGHSGQKSWIVSFSGIDTIDEARQIVGSNLLVKADDRPELEDGEFYTRDLIGMRIFLKETGKPVGTVVNVYNFGAGDLLKVLLDSTGNSSHQHGSNGQSSTSKGSHVWIPFVQDIVPHVDPGKREMWIVPPKGLLELNVRSDSRSKKERRLMEWKDRRRMQQRLAVAKKILTEMDQRDIIEILRSGDKIQSSSLAKQIASIDFKVFQHAISRIDQQNDSSSNHMSSTLLLKNALSIRHEELLEYRGLAKSSFCNEWRKGLELLRHSKAAIVLIREHESGFESGPHVKIDLEIHFQKLLKCIDDYMEMGDDHVNIPFVIICPTHEVDIFQKHVSDNDYFGLDSQKVWIIEEAKLPMISMPTEQAQKNILFKSPQEILQGPMGTGSVFRLLALYKLAEAFRETGVQYVQICNWSSRLTAGHPLMLGMVASHGHHSGFKLSQGDETGGDLDVVVSMDLLNKLCGDVKHLHFDVLPEQHQCVELHGDQWLAVLPEEPNAYRLWCDVHSCVLRACLPDKLCAMKVV